MYFMCLNSSCSFCICRNVRRLVHGSVSRAHYDGHCKENVFKKLHPLSLEEWVQLVHSFCPFVPILPTNIWSYCRAELQTILPFCKSVTAITELNLSHRKTLDLSQQALLLCLEGVWYSLNVQTGNGPNRRTDFSLKAFYEYDFKFLTHLKSIMEDVADICAILEQLMDNELCITKSRNGIDRCLWDNSSYLWTPLQR